MRWARDETQDFTACFRRHCGFELLDGLGQAEAIAAEDAVGGFDFCLLIAADPRASQADGVYSDTASSPGNEEVRRDVLADHAQATDHGQFANLHELMHGDMPRQDRFATNSDVSTEQYTVDQDGFISDGTIVANMRTGHHQATLANARRGVGGSSTMHGDVFTQGRPVTNVAITNRTTKREILREVADHTTSMNPAVAADVRVAEQMHVRPNNGPCPDMHRPANHTIRSDLSSRINHCVGVDDCGRMNRHQETLKQEELGRTLRGRTIAGRGRS